MCHAGLDPRHGFLPPQVRVWPLEADAPETWERIPTVPLWTDPEGAEIVTRPIRVQLAHDTHDLYLQATLVEPSPVIKPDLTPDSPHFWTQDHVELRFQPQPLADLTQVQFILAASGRCFDNQGWWRDPERHGIRFHGGPTSSGWQTELRVPLALLGFGAAAVPPAVRGLVAHCRWGDGYPDLACAAPVVLGFSHAERFAEFHLMPAAAPVRLSALHFTSPELTCGDNLVRVELLNASGTPQSGRLRLMAEDGLDGHGHTWWVPVDLSGVRAVVSTAVPLRRPRYTRVRLWFEQHTGPSDLGAVTLRAPPPDDLPASPGAHPYLQFDAAALPELRAKAARPLFDAVCAGWRRPIPEGQAVPDPADPRGLEITAHCLNWFRVAKESMVRDGAGNRKPASARIWNLLPPEAQEAFRAVVRHVTPHDDDLAVLLPALNALLRRPDLYEAAAFAEVHVPPETQTLLQRGIGSLNELQLMRLNRALLQASIECMGAFGLDLLGRAGACLGPWLVTGDRRWISQATDHLRVAEARLILAAETHLHEGMLGGQLALAYDAFEPHLDAAQRAVWLGILKRLLDLYLRTARGRRWTVTTIANANPVGNGGSGLVALALLRESPAAAREALRHARRNVWQWLDYCAGADGGNTEGVQYWTYGQENLLLFARALERVLGHDDGLLGHASVRRAMNMVRVGLTNDGGLHGVNDTIPLPVGGVLGWFAAGRFGDPLGLWYGDHAWRQIEARCAAGRPAAYAADPLCALLFRPDVPECRTAPPLPTAVALADIQYATIRSTPAWDSPLVAGLKGSRPPYTHHNQADTGSFWLDVRGERMLIDPGYYKPEPSHHCLPCVAGRVPAAPAGFTGVLTTCRSAGSFRCLVCDSSAAYELPGARVVRHLVMVGDRALVVFDDIRAVGADGAAPVESWFQCGGCTEPLERRGVRVRGQRATLELQFHGPAGTRVTCEAERDLHDVHWGYHFADCRWFPVTVRYAAVAPLVTVIADCTGQPAPAYRLLRGPGRVAVVWQDGPAVCFRQLAEGWMWDA